ncbi:NADH-dependent flavin oxidoreductase [Enterococcus faecium]|uniref:NADH-dependent flavin oxidoreductase n=1 Tax=Enterococcus TaxID=1350 RepID=UPI00223B1E57|nr:NADH-dependent flavin oxidoreductase [Enterococcus faecium]MCS8593244.1 NADH-dependent flavin oxidoreductase [Enterococcus faecium]
MTEFNETMTFASGATLKNRLMMSPMTTQLSFYNGVVTDDEINYYAQRANGVGAIITGAANVQDGGKGWHGELSIAHDEMIPRLSELANAIQSNGAKAIVQIFHGGRMTNRAVLSGEQTVSASAIPAERPGAETPRAMSEEEIVETIQSFGEATRRAIEAGFDGVELHGANTYLIQQFFSPHSNRREDKWGGNLENRYRFIDEVMKSVFQAVDQYAKKPFIVGYRFSPEEFETPGIRFEDTIWLLERLRETKLDYLHVSLNNYSRVARSEKYNEKTVLEYAHETLQGKIPLVAAGGVKNRTDVQNILDNAELVAVGQQLIVDPEWAEKLIENRDTEFVTKPLNEAVKDLYIPSPLYNFLKMMF